jgi:hypothetical protein
MTTVEVHDGRISKLLGFHVRKESPKWEIYRAIASAAQLGDKLFQKNSPYRIRGFLKDRPGEHWSKLLRDAPEFSAPQSA